MRKKFRLLNLLQMMVNFMTPLVCSIRDAASRNKRGVQMGDVIIAGLNLRNLLGTTACFHYHQRFDMIRSRRSSCRKIHCIDSHTWEYTVVAFFDFFIVHLDDAESSKWRHLLIAAAKDCSFLSAIETLQLISTTFIPAEKLNIIQSTFKVCRSYV